MNRIEMKERAKEMARENFKEFWKGYLIVFVISFLCSFAIDILFEKGSMMYNCLTLIASFFTSTLSVGFYLYILKIVRSGDYTKEDIFKFVGNILPIAAISILMMIFVFLWSILLIIPGIIVALSYSMVFYIYAENQEYTPMEYLSQSKEMMKGYKWDYFVFVLSFLGWIILGILTLGIGLIWVIPYVSFAETIYYDELKKVKEIEAKEKI